MRKKKTSKDFSGNEKLNQAKKFISENKIFKWTQFKD